MRRLTRAEYAKTTNALFGDVSEAATQLAPEVVGSPTGNVAELQAVSTDQVTAYFEVAKQLAERATRDSQALGELAPCAATAKPDAACARDTIEAFASRAFRRVPTGQEVDELMALHTAVSDSGGDFTQATRAVIAAILQAPEFLYRIEWGTGEGPRPDVQRLTGDEMATRLSYLIWGSAPDLALRAAATSGALLEPGGIAQQARRLLDDPRAHEGLAEFFADYLRLYPPSEVPPSDPPAAPELPVLLGEATQRFLVAQIFEHHASWPSVLTADTAIVNGPVANVYGIAGITGDEWREVSLDPTQRLGLLTQPGFLATGLRGDAINPIFRGFRILETFLCRIIPPEPPDLPGTLPDPPTGPETTRQLLTRVTSPSECKPCHSDMDQMGYAFENFDTIGSYRTQQNGLDIDASVNVSFVGPTSGPLELVKRLSTMPEVSACFAQRFAEFSLAKSLEGDASGACLTRDLGRRFEAAGYDVRQLILDFTQTDAFLYLPKDR